MRKSAWKILLSVLITAALLSAAGCQSIKNFISARNSSSSNEEGTQGYNIYYIDKDETRIKAFPYKLSSTQETDIINECLDALRAKPDDSDYRAVLGDSLDVSDVGYPEDDKTLKLYFPETYNNMSHTTEILVRAAIVKTLTQFSGIVNYVSFCVGEHWITGSDGTALKMNGEDFVSSLNLSKQQMTDGEFTLYFASEDGKSLQASDVSMKYDSSTRPEQAVLDALIRGPSTDGCSAVLSRSTQIKSTYVSDGVCQVDFNQGFLEKVDDHNFSLNLYSVVNSLAQLDGIDKVHITVEGEDVATGPDDVPMGGDLSPNMDLVSEQ